MKKLVLVLSALFVFPSVATADMVIFKSGSAKKGVIEDQTPTSVKLRVKDMVVGIPRANIERIEYATPEENQKLLDKWTEEAKRREEQREKRRQEQEKFEAGQRAKGLVEVNGRWVSPAEAESRREESIRRQIQSQRAAEAAEAAEPEEEPEPELPPAVDRLPEEMRQVFIENLKRQEEIKVNQVVTESQGVGRVVVRGAVVNGSDAYARNANLEVRLYGEGDELLLAEDASVVDLAPGKARALNVAVRIDHSLVKRAEVSVVSVRWE